MSAMMSSDETLCVGQTAREEAGKPANEDMPDCEDKIARIATDMMQVQCVPRLQEGIAYYKSKVNEISTHNK